MTTYVFVKHYLKTRGKKRMKPKIYKTPSVSALSLDEQEFKKSFVLSKSSFRLLLRKIGAELEPKSGTRTAIPEELKLLCALRYFATGFLQRELGEDLRLNLSQATVSRFVVAASSAICKILLSNVSLPNPQEFEKIKKAFSSISNFPGVVGIIGCIHVGIMTPQDTEGSSKSGYYNASGKPSIKVLLVCDAKMKIRYVCAKYPGASMDWFTLKYSDMYSNLSKELHNENCSSWFLANSNFQQLHWVMIPFQEPKTTSEENYNASHASTMTVFQRCMNLLRSRFQCLSKVLRHCPSVAEKVICACIILHNMCIEEDMDSMSFVSEDEQDTESLSGISHVPPCEATAAAETKRKSIAEEYFDCCDSCL